MNAGGIWAPSGPAVDEDGNLYVATGNSFSNTEFDLGDSVIKLSPTLDPAGSLLFLRVDPNNPLARADFWQSALRGIDRSSAYQL